MMLDPTLLWGNTVLLQLPPCLVGHTVPWHQDAMQVHDVEILRPDIQARAIFGRKFKLPILC